MQFAAFLGANFMLVPRWLGGGGDQGAAAVIFTALIPVSIALLLSLRFAPRVLGPDDTKRAIHGSAFYAVLTGWLHGVRTVVRLPTVAAALSGLAAHRMVVGINSLLVLLLVHHMKDADVDGLGTALLFFGAAGLGAFLSNVLTPLLVRRWGRYATANAALVAAAVIQIGRRRAAAAGDGGVRLLAGDRPARWSSCAPTRRCRSTSTTRCAATCSRCRTPCSGSSFIAAVTVAAAFIPDDGHAPAFALFGSVIYLIGLLVHSLVGRRRQPRSSKLTGGTEMAGPGPFVADLQAESDDLDALVAPLAAQDWAR